VIHSLVSNRAEGETGKGFTQKSALVLREFRSHQLT
jgi:hypothetical protein